MAALKEWMLKQLDGNRKCFKNSNYKMMLIVFRTIFRRLKQRILIAQVNQPKIIILDNLAGLDPKERIRIRNIISKIAREKIVLFATHVVSDIEHIAKEVILMKNGKLLDHRSPLEFCKTIQGKVFELSIQEEELKKVQGEFLISNISQQANGLLVRILANQKPLQYQYIEAVANLEDVYLYYFSDEMKD
ncbi:hypothetical protein [Faecalibacillus intestinalis]|uniref:hypothetical protein n=1 Tax=Faecalibacillus intestinalis TaxID=1982626 RepID=UPI003991ACE9